MTEPRVIGPTAFSFEGEGPVASAVARDLSVMAQAQHPANVRFRLLRHLPGRASVRAGDGAVLTGAVEALLWNYRVRICPGEVWTVDAMLDPRFAWRMVRRGVQLLPALLQRWLTPTWSSFDELLGNGFIHKVLWPTMALVLPRHRATFIRASGLAHDEGAILIGGWGWSGKTTLTFRLLREMSGARFLSDDLTVLGADGIAYPSTHLVPVDPFVAQHVDPSRHATVRSRGRLDWLLRARSSGLRSAIRKVSPTSLFGGIAGPTHLRTAFWIDCGGTEIQVERCDPEGFATRAAAVLVQDLPELVTPLLIAQSFPGRVPELPSLREFIDGVTGTIRNGLVGTDVWIVTRPPSADATAVVDVLRRRGAV